MFRSDLSRSSSLFRAALRGEPRAAPPLVAGGAPSDTPSSGSRSVRFSQPVKSRDHFAACGNTREKPRAGYLKKGRLERHRERETRGVNCSRTNESAKNERNSAAAKEKRERERGEKKKRKEDRIEAGYGS